MSMDRYFSSVFDWFKDKEHEEIKSCMVCGRDSYHLDNDIAKCDYCSFVWRFRAPTQKSLDAFYTESQAMKQWAEIKTSPQETIRQLSKFSWVYEQIKYMGVKSVLDVGCGNGFFLNNAKDVSKVGIEPHEESRSHCTYPTYKDYETFKDSIHGHKKYDLITMFGILEHFKDPKAEIKKYESYLSENGKFCVIVPNVESLVVKTLKQQCSTFCPQHLWYYSFETLWFLFASLGFEYGYGTTIEAETEPILRHMNGHHPYSKVDSVKYPKELDDGILDNHLGYKLISIFSRNVI